MGPLSLTPVLLPAVQAGELPLRPLHAVLLHMHPSLLLAGVLLATVQAVPLHGCDDVVELGSSQFMKTSGKGGFIIL